MNNEYLQTEREIKGYVEIIYSPNLLNENSDLNRTEIFPTPASIVEYPTMIDDVRNKRISKNYASLEENYFLLDGSFVLPDANYYNKDSGFISANIENTYTISITYTNEQPMGFTKNDGLTLYFKDNIPRNIDVTYTDFNDETIVTYNLTNENIHDYVLNIKNDEEIENIKNITIVLYNMENENRRLRISKIDYGSTDILKDNTLINFNIIENIGDLNLEFPSNQLTVTLYDENDMFDINNPSGYANFLNDNLTVKVKPYIGILTENKGIVYDEDLPTFFLNKWNNNKNQITLNCVDYLEKMKMIKNADRCYYLRLTPYNCLQLNEMIKNTTSDLNEVDSFENFENDENYVHDVYIDTTNSLEYMQQLMVWLWGYIYSDNDKLIINDRSNSLTYNHSLSLNDNLLEEPIFNIRELIKSISITCYDGYYTDETKQWQSADVIYLTNSERASQGNEIVELPEYHELHVEAQGISQDMGINKVFNTAEYCPAVVSPATNITFYDLSTCTLMTSKYIKTFNEKGKEIIIDNKFFAEYPDSLTEDMDVLCETVCDKINAENKKYNVSIKYVGDPNIKPNMIVPFETQYGNKQLKVLKHTLTFNGGLTGTIEGVGD